VVGEPEQALVEVDVEQNRSKIGKGDRKAFFYNGLN